MKISLSEFGGMAPKIEPRRLAEKLAVRALNTSFDAGVVEPATIGTVPSTDFAPLSASVRSILRPANSGTRLAFTSDTTGEAFASLVAPSDKWGRIYYTTALGARFTVSDNYIAGGLKINPVSYALGIKAPQYPALVGTPAYTKGDDEPDLIRVSYVTTFVDKYGHEGPPSPVSTVAKLPYDLAFTCKLTFTAESLPDANVSGAVRRIYRAAFDGTSTAFQFIADVPFASSSWTDSIPLGTESEELISTDWSPPPILEQMVPVASNFVAGFTGNTLCYSESRLPHAWPEGYRFPLKYQIVGLKPTQNGLLIATTGKPYWGFGGDPAAAVPVELDSNYPCLSAKSLVDMGTYVMYATQDGLVAVAGQDVKIVTGDFIDRLTWLRDFSPASIVAFAYEGRYVFSVGGVWWVFDPSAGGGFSTLGELAVSPSLLRQAYYDARRDVTVLLNTSGVAFDVVSKAGGTFLWRSKTFEVSPVSFGVAQVLATEYPVTLRAISDGVERTYQAVNERPFRLQAGFLATTWAFEIEGSGRVTEVRIAQSPEEFA